jgi:hypothetical protein
MTGGDALAGRADQDARAAIEAHLRALGYGPERVAIARGAEAPEGHCQDNFLGLRQAGCAILGA